MKNFSECFTHLVCCRYWRDGVTTRQLIGGLSVFFYTRCWLVRYVLHVRYILNFHQNVQRYKKYHLLEQFSVRNKTGLLLVLLYFVLIGIEKSRHSLNQSDKKLNPITTWSPTFSRALCSWFGFSLSFYRLFRVFFFSSDLLWFCFYDTQSKSTLYVCTNQNWIGIQSVQ